MTARYGGLAFAVGVLGVFIYALFEGRGWSSDSRLLLVTIAAPAVVLGLLQIAREIRAPSGLRVPPEARTTLSALGWSVAFFAGLWALGALATFPLFSLLYLRVAAREGWIAAIGYAAAAWAFPYALFDRVLHVPLPSGVIALPFVG